MCFAIERHKRLALFFCLAGKKEKTSHCRNKTTCEELLRQSGYIISVFKLFGDFSSRFFIWCRFVRVCNLRKRCKNRQGQSRLRVERYAHRFRSKHRFVAVDLSACQALFESSLRLPSSHGFFETSKSITQKYYISEQIVLPTNRAICSIIKNCKQEKQNTLDSDVIVRGRGVFVFFTFTFSFLYPRGG